MNVTGLPIIIVLAASLWTVPSRAAETGPAAPEPELRLHFRDASLESVLQYLSDAAGYVIVLKTDSVKGKVNVWSNQPVTREEALRLVTSALNENGYTAIRDGRTLTIRQKDAAKKAFDLPVKSGNRPEDIPKNDEMVTQIVPIRFINATQVSRVLQPLLPDSATMTANEGGNAVVLTDSQTTIHRMVEIIHALDTAVSSISAVKVFPLRYADSKAVASVIKDLFAPQETSRGGAGAQGQAPVSNTMQFGPGAAGPGGPGGFGPGGGAGLGASPGQGSGPSASAGSGGVIAPRVVAVAEERSNSLVVSAPEEQMQLINRLVKEIDVNVQDVTELRVFHLKNADAQETTDLLSSLFGDSTSGNNQDNRNPMQFAGGPFGGGFQGGGPFGGGGGPFGGAGGASGARNNRGSNTDQSSRLQKQSRVVAVPDLRSSSVVVSAGREIMGQIAKMVADLDSDPARKQQVFVFSVPNSDPDAMQQMLEGLFPASTSGNTANSRSRQQNSAGSQLSNRATQNQNQGMGRSTGNSGFGGLGNTSGGLGSGLGSSGR